MMLLTQEIKKRLPALRTQEVDDPIAQVKFFDPCGSWTWFVIEYDPEDELFYGLVYGIEREFGYFSLAELQSIKGPLGLGIERDLHFEPCPISQCKSPCRI